MVAARTWRGIPVPFFFQTTTAEAFRSMQMREDDVILSSIPKTGTTWVHKILYQMLHGIDSDGKPNPAPSTSIGSTNQVYPEALTLTRDAPVDPELSPEANEMRKKFFGGWGFEDDMLGQPAPRLISTHLYGDFLPSELIAPNGKGRLILVLRNMKDTLASLHFFRGEPKDGWLGNEHGPGSLSRFLSPDCSNAYGSSFTNIREHDRLVNIMQASGRVLVLYYEDLCRCLPAQLDRIATFLGMELTPAKRAAVAESVDFQKVKEGGGLAGMLLRKGGYGDWKNHLGPSEWELFEAAFDAALDGVALAEPLRYYQWASIGGLPPPRAEQTMTVDPREWPNFVRHTLVEGRLVRDTLIATTGGAFQRPPSEYNSTVMLPGTPDAKHIAEAERYHLFVSGVCPWANGVRAARHMLGLEDVISMDVADGQSDAGWVLLGGTSCPPWSEREEKPFWLHEAYQLGDPLGTTRITMPVLWDKKLGCIVSNDSWSILKMFATSFRPLARKDAPDLAPAELAQEMEETHASIYDNLLNGVYKVGVNRLKGNAAGADAAAEVVYATLESLEDRLSQRRFLLGGAQPTAVDIRLTMTLLRFDAAYHKGFALRSARGGILVAGTEGQSGYPVLAAYVRDMYPRVKDTVDWASYRQYYRWAVGVAKDEPLPDLEQIRASADAPHGREGL